MPILTKRQLIEKIIDSVRNCGWNLLYLSRPSAHPLRLRVFRDAETFNVRIYIWNMTHGGGRLRPADEYRIQITGVLRFEPEPEGKTLILGWWDEAGVFAGFDYRKHSGPLGASPSMQIREQFLREAYENGFSPCNKGNREIAIAFRPDFLVEYVRFLEHLHDVGRSPIDFEVLSSIATDPTVVNDLDIERVSQQRRSAVASIRRALRDNSFKEKVLTAYSHHCAVCSLQMDLVEAAHITLVQIGFLKTLYFGQQNEDGTLINPIMPLNTLSLGLLTAYKQPFYPVILDSKMNS
jgi:putative restriction endonuclease